MKLLKKLLPLVTIGATACTIAPALTACAGDTVYTIKFDANGGSTVADQKVVKDQLIHEPTTTKDGYLFAGWMNGDKVWDFENDKATGDLTLKAAWIEEPEFEGTDLLAYDILNPEQHEATTISETGTAGLAKAGKMYFAEDGKTTAEINARIKKDLMYYLAEEAKTLSVAELVDPGCIPDFGWVGTIQSAYADINGISVTYVDGTNKAYVSGNITLSLTAKLIDETTKGELGTYILLTNHVLANVPYIITDYDEADHYWTIKTSLTGLAAETQVWSIARQYYGIALYDNGKAEMAQDAAVWNKSNMPKEGNIKPINYESIFMDTVAHGKE